MKNSWIIRGNSCLEKFPQKISVCLNKLKIALAFLEAKPQRSLYIFFFGRCAPPLSIQVIPVVEHPGAVLAAVELTLLVDGVIQHTEGGAFPTLGTDYRVAFRITLMCHWNMFLLFI